MESGGMSKLEIKYVSTDSLRPYAGNARTHSKKQIRQIADSIERFGFANPILVSDDRQVLADMTEADRRAYILADNKLAEQAGWDRDTLAIPPPQTGRPTINRRGA
jgi:hypothetical protein